MGVDLNKRELAGDCGGLDLCRLEKSGICHQREVCYFDLKSYDFLIKRYKVKKKS